MRRAKEFSAPWARLRSCLRTPSSMSRPAPACFGALIELLRNLRTCEGWGGLRASTDVFHSAHFSKCPTVLSQFAYLSTCRSFCFTCSAAPRVEHPANVVAQNLRTVLHLKYHSVYVSYSVYCTCALPIHALHFLRYTESESTVGHFEQHTMRDNGRTC